MSLSVRSVGHRLVLRVWERTYDADGKPTLAPLNLALFSQLQLVFTKPGGAELAVAATILNAPGSDGRVYYDIGPGWLVPGKWRVSPRCTIDSGHDYYGEWVAFVPSN